MNKNVSYLLSLSVGLTVSVIGCLPLGIPESRQVDLSDFREFEFTRWATSCEDGTSYKAWIRYEEDGSYTVEFSEETCKDYPEFDWDDLSEAVVEGSPLPEYPSGEVEHIFVGSITVPIPAPVTVVGRPAEPKRMLTESEVQRVLEVFSNVTINTVMPDGICADFVSGTSVRWDDYRVSTNVTCLDAPTDELDAETLDRIIQLLDSLRQVEE